MTEFVFQGLLGASVTLASIYLLLALYTFRKLLWLQSNSTAGLNTRKLFVMTCLLTAVLRFMSFGSMAVLDLNSIHFRLHSGAEVDDDEGNAATKMFFEKALLVLFDFPDFCCISAYVLLIVVWAEAYLKSRRHWLSSYRFRRNWMLGYFMFNVILYSTQTALYSLLFIPEIDQTVQTNLIYLTLATFNGILPLFWCLVYIYLTIKFSGFPYSTPDAKLRLGSLNWLGLLWSLARIMWGTVALTSVLNGWLTEAQKSKEYYTAFLIVLFMLSEVIPILFSLQKKLIQRLGEKNMDAPAPSIVSDTTGFGPGAAMFNAAAGNNAMKEPLLTSSALSGHSHRSLVSNRNSAGGGNAKPATTAVSIARSPNQSSFNMLYAGTDKSGKNDVCIESPLSNAEFIHLYGSEHSRLAVKSAFSSSDNIPITSGLSPNSAVDISQYHGKESFDDKYIDAMYNSPPPQHHLHHLYGQQHERESDATSDRDSFVTANSGKSPTTGGWANWLGL